MLKIVNLPLLMVLESSWVLSRWGTGPGPGQVNEALMTLVSNS